MTSTMNVELAIPLLIQEGWLRHQEKMRSHSSGADGVVGIDEVFQNAFFRRRSHSRPPRPLLKRRLRDFFLMSRPPLLCQEGSGAPNSFTPASTAPTRTPSLVLQQPP